MALRWSGLLLMVVIAVVLPACQGTDSALMDPSRAQEQAPDQFKVRFDTTRGPVTIEVVREWAPKGADRFYNLVKLGYFKDVAFFRVVDGFVVQFGISGDPAINAIWKDANITDDPVKASNQRGYITFATGGPDTRTTQLFINLADNTRLDRMRFAPFGRVAEGMEVVDSFYSGYGEGEPRGQGPSQDRIHSEGNAYLRKDFPKLDYLIEARILN